jgi:hypothetical protein
VRGALDVELEAGVEVARGARILGGAAAKHLLELGFAARDTAAVRVVHVVDEELEQSVDLVVVEVIAKRRVQVLERNANREPLEIA